jgi:hypothetical protein
LPAGSSSGRVLVLDEPKQGSVPKR